MLLVAKMDASQKKEYRIHRRLKWTKENGRELYVFYFDPLLNCVEYLQWKRRDNILHRTDEPYEDEDSTLWEKITKFIHGWFCYIKLKKRVMQRWILQIIMDKKRVDKLM